MDEHRNKQSENKLNAGRGVAKQRSSDTNNNTINKENDKDRPDERARKAGY